MQIKTYNPRCSVLAWHGSTQYDITPYCLQVTTHKALGETQGQFAILVQFRQDKRWDKLLAVMDYVEIRMTRFAKTPKIRMRGFISNIRRTRVIDDSGSIRRTITINGNDYGKLIANYQIYYAADVPGQNTVGSDVDPAQMLMLPLLSENMGLFGNGTSETIPLSQLIPEFIDGGAGDGPISTWIGAMQTTTPAIPNLGVVVSVSDLYQLNWISLQSLQGGLDQVISQFSNSPWCEWFICDVDSGPLIIHRDTPFKDQNGNYVLGTSALPSTWTVSITDEDIIEDDIGTSDSEAYNYFFTYPSLFPQGDLAYKFAIINQTQEFGTGSAQSQQATEESLTIATNPKILRASIYRYGLQIMEQASPAIPIIATDSDASVDPMSAQLSIVMNGWLFQTFGWAPQMLNGTLQLKGNENIIIGQYLTNTDMGEEYYVEAVDDTFTISQIGSMGDDDIFTYTQQVQVTRGRSLS